VWGRSLHSGEKKAGMERLLVTMSLIAAGLVLPVFAEAAFDYCVEAEAIARNSDVRAFPKSVVLGRGGTLSLPFEIPSSTDIRVWVRARAVTHSNNALYLSINRMDESDEAIWDIPVTPVLRWQRATRRGNEGAFYLATQINWPGTMAHGRTPFISWDVSPRLRLMQYACAISSYPNRLNV
jgi:hypothetical protein